MLVTCCVLLLASLDFGSSDVTSNPTQNFTTHDIITQPASDQNPTPSISPPSTSARTRFIHVSFPAAVGSSPFYSYPAYQALPSPMPRRGPPTSGYEQIAQDEELFDSDNDESSSLVSHRTSRLPIQPHPTAIQSASSVPRYARVPGMTRARSNSAVDIKKLNARLEHWAGEIANKFKFKKDRSQHEHPPLEILHSVFVAPEGYRSYVADTATLELPEVAEDAHLTREQFDEIVESVRTAISKGVDPKLIKQGSSGSYFMRDIEGSIVAVFKPKDEEPYELPLLDFSAEY
jgi:hypothetical protein